MLNKIRVSAIAITTGLAAAFPQGAIALNAAENKPTTTIPDNKPTLGTWGVELDEMAPATKPGDDFFHHVNGDWLNNFEIPADFTNYGAFTKLFELSEARVGEIIEKTVTNADSALERKIANYYKAYLDTAAIDEKGLAWAKADLAYIRSLKTHDDVAKAMARGDLALMSPIGATIYVDEKQPDRYRVYFFQSGIGMPNRDYYLEEKFSKQKSGYRAVVEALMTLAGAPVSPERADAIVALETKIAEIHWPMARARDRDQTYNPVSIADINDEYPGFPWAVFLKESGVAGQDEFIVAEDEAVAKLAALFADTPVAVWRDYLSFHYLHGFASVLPSAIDDANFDFFGRVLQGQQEQRPRHKRAIAAVNGSLGEAVGRIYEEKYFTPDAERKMDALIDNIIAAFDDRIRALDWMSDETKVEALAKLQGFNPFIGGPSKWRDYADLRVSPAKALANAKASNASMHQYMLSRLGKPVVPENEWAMTPQTVNAYYSPPRNAIYFPAAILQAPFFDPYADPAVNYGGIGAVIGHEIGHGFDDQGRKSDGTGALRDWWTSGDDQRFKALADKLGAQFAQYNPIDDMTIDPELTMGENIGDLGGLAVAYYAYKKSLNGKEAPVIDGYTGDQRFFLSYAQIWRRKHRDEDLRWRMVADPHSPAEYRVNGIVRNMDEWYEAFDVKQGDALYLAPEDRVHIW